MKLGTAVIINKPNKEQKVIIKKLQEEAFSDISKEEIRKDFYNPPDAHIIYKIKNVIVGYASLHHSNITFQGREIKLGGFGGVCTRKDFQRKGVATEVSRTAIKYLNQKKYDIAFLTVDTAKNTSHLYEKVGFVMLPRKFSWTDADGKLEMDHGGMIAPLNSKELFDYVLNGKDVLYVGNGCW